MLITSASYLISSPDIEKCPSPDRPEYAFIGRSNVGKSSLINMICLKQNLAKTSSTPGKTQLINHFEIASEKRAEGTTASRGFAKWYIVDLPGFGFAKVSLSKRKQWEKMIEEYLRKRPNLMNVFVVIDSRHEPQKIDIGFVNKLGAWQVPFCLVFTKADKESQRIVSQHVKGFLQALKATWQFLPQHFVTSSIKRLGRENILTYISQLNDEFMEIESKRK